MAENTDDYQARCQAALADYARRLPVRTICELHKLGRTTVARLVNRAGLEKRKGKGPGSYARSDGDAEAKKFDKFKVIPESPCECGHGCGLTFRKVKGQRTRRWAQDCPYAAEARAEQKRRYARTQRAKREHISGKVIRRGPPPREPRTPVHWCSACGGLAHRRPEGRACKCGLTFSPDSFQTLGGTTIVVAP